MKNDRQRISGDRWLVVTENPDEYASKLGGKVQKA